MAARVVAIRKKQQGPLPIGVIVIERHGRTQTGLKFPLSQQGKYPLTVEAKKDAALLGSRLAAYLLKRIPPSGRARGVRLHFAPTPYIRALQTAHQTARGLSHDLRKAKMKVWYAESHLRAARSLRFLETEGGTPILLPHYPAAGSPEAEQWEQMEDAWAAGLPVQGVESLGRTEQRTRAPALLRRLLFAAARKPDTAGSLTRRPLPVYAWVSHGPARPPAGLQRARAPIGLALAQLLSAEERRRFHISPEIARGEAVAVILYNDGSIHAQHVTPAEA